MKVYHITLLLCGFSLHVLAQDKVEQYCELKLSKKTFSSKYAAEINYGNNSLIISSNQAVVKKDFESVPDAMNYLGALGWKLVSSTTTGKYDSDRAVIFKKEFVQLEEKPVVVTKAGN